MITLVANLLWRLFTLAVGRVLPHGVGAAIRKRQESETAPATAAT
jgi:hypothetical protein